MTPSPTTKTAQSLRLDHVHAPYPYNGINGTNRLLKNYIPTINEEGLGTFMELEEKV